MRTHTWPFLVVAGRQRRIFENCFLYHQCYLIRATEGNRRGCPSEEESHAIGIFTGETNIVYFQGKYWRQPVPPGCLVLPRILPLENRICFGPFHRQALCAEH